MDLAFLHPLYEHQGPWASVYVDLSRHTEDTPHERELTAAAVARELAELSGTSSTNRAACTRRCSSHASWYSTRSAPNPIRTKRSSLTARASLQGRKARSVPTPLYDRPRVVSRAGNSHTIG